MVVTVDQHGNTSAASVPLALDAAVRDGRIRRGHHVLLQAWEAVSHGDRCCYGGKAMKLAFVFPGQGSQSVGMLSSFDDPAVGQILDRASAALGQDIGSLIANGPAEDLNLTVNTQPRCWWRATLPTRPGGPPAVLLRRWWQGTALASTRR